MNYNYQAPDLASVLATLSALNQQSQAAAGQAVTATQPYPNPLPPQNGAQAQNSQTWRQIVQPQALPPKEQALPKMTDPATITDWPSGLRCVMKTVAINERIIQDIKRMIKVQHEHEQEWWDAREALVKKQGARAEGQKKLDEVLKAVGGALTGGNVKFGPKEAAEELKIFDTKVYKAQHQMVKEMSAKLKNLGIPFFGTRSELVRKSKGDHNPKDDADDPNSKAVTEAQLVELQRKMLTLLEELCQP